MTPRLRWQSFQIVRFNKAVFVYGRSSEEECGALRRWVVAARTRGPALQGCLFRSGRRLQWAGRQRKRFAVDHTDGLCVMLEMPSKTISLEVDAYDRLKSARRAGESFSEVVRRITLPPAKATAADLLADVNAGSFGRGVDWIAVKRAVAGRRRSRDLRSS